jgi:hypothetical protein
MMAVARVSGLSIRVIYRVLNGTASPWAAAASLEGRW